MTRVCYFGAFDPHYPRNQILRHGLALHGVEPVVVNAPQSLPTWRKLPLLVRQFGQLARDCGAIVLAEFSQSLAGLAWALARRRQVPLVVDFFTSMVESAVVDRQQTAPGSLTARRLRFIDGLALRLSDAVLVDTHANAYYVAHEFAVPSHKITAIPVGAFTDWFHPAVKSDVPKSDGLLVQFYGTYIPLHGIETILRAVARLHTRDDLRFELLGRGQTYDQMRALADELNLARVTFSQPVPPSRLPGRVAAADICLGIFGGTDKAKRVVPNKLYQALAMRKPAISADTPALREVFQPGVHLSAVPAAESAALAEAIGELAESPSRREALADAGYRHLAERYTPDQLGMQLADLLTGLGVGRS